MLLQSLQIHCFLLGTVELVSKILLLLTFTALQTNSVLLLYIAQLI